jgi:protein O-GlcNAc transferase
MSAIASTLNANQDIASNAKSDARNDVLNDAMIQAITNHRAGRFHEATELYRAVLEVNPNHADASHNLGVLLISANRIDEALLRLCVAIEMEPAEPQYWLSYLTALHLAKRNSEALELLAVARQHGLSGPAIDKLARDLNSSSSH